jgi:hypothetical protein
MTRESRAKGTGFRLRLAGPRRLHVAHLRDPDGAPIEIHRTVLKAEWTEEHPRKALNTRDRNWLSRSAERVNCAL